MSQDCRLLQTVKYIGMMSTTPSRRITMHLKSGATEKRMREPHNITLTRQIIEYNISIIKLCPYRLRLASAEALLIKERPPTITPRDNTITRT